MVSQDIWIPGIASAVLEQSTISREDADISMEIITSAPKRALAITPHPDDCEGGCGGTLSKWIQESGTVGVVVLCTNGDKGTSDREMPSAKLASIREREQQEAADVMGADVVFLSYPDGGLEDTMLFRSQLVREIRRHKPEVILCIDPYRSISHTHRDHRMSGQVAIDAAFTYAWNEMQFRDQITQEGLEPYQVREAYLWGSETPDIFVDIGDFLDMKAESLSRHVSQMSSDPVARAKRIREGAARQGQAAGLTYAEGFRRINFDLGSRDGQFLRA